MVSYFKVVPGVSSAISWYSDKQHSQVERQKSPSSEEQG